MQETIFDLLRVFLNIKVFSIGISNEVLGIQSLVECLLHVIRISSYSLT